MGILGLAYTPSIYQPLFGFMRFIFLAWRLLYDYAFYDAMAVLSSLSFTLHIQRAWSRAWTNFFWVGHGTLNILVAGLAAFGVNGTGADTMGSTGC